MKKPKCRLCAGYHYAHEAHEWGGEVVVEPVVGPAPVPLKVEMPVTPEVRGEMALTTKGTPRRRAVKGTFDKKGYQDRYNADYGPARAAGMTVVEWRKWKILHPEKDK